MSDKITFKELVEKISANSKQSEQSTNDFIHELANIIETSLGSGEKISISGFGKFELRWMDERSGRNPQTGEEITVPGQNKVVFKPYKSLRESVNKPFENLESQVIGDETDDEQLAPGTPALSVSASHVPTSQGKEKKDDATLSESEADLIIERESPVESSFRVKKKTKSGHKTVSNQSLTGADNGLTSIFKEKMTDQDNLARNLQDNGNFRWSYSAAVIIVLLAIFLIVFMVNRPESSREGAISPVTQQTYVSQTQERQVTESDNLEPNKADPAQDTGGDKAGVQPVTHSSSSPSPGKETITHSVSEGETLWAIAQNQYGDPYLWPIVYEANKRAMKNPNLLTTENSLRLPSLADPDNLSESERNMVALGYISVYDWILENNPDDARYYLWAAGSFSQEVLRDASKNLNEADLAFATQG